MNTSPHLLALPPSARSAVRDLPLQLTLSVFGGNQVPATWGLVESGSKLLNMTNYWNWILFGRADEVTIWTCSSQSNDLRWKTCNLFTARRMWERAVAQGWKRCVTYT